MGGTYRPDPDGDYQPRSPMGEFMQAMRDMVTRARAQGAQPVLVTPPLDAQRYFDWVSRKLSPERILKYLGDVQYIYRWQERYAGAVRTLAAELGCALYDMARSVPGRCAICADCCARTAYIPTNRAMNLFPIMPRNV